MRKYGRTAAGAQRWRCTDCAASYSFRREDQTQQATFAAFVDYPLGKDAQHEVDGTATGRTLRRRFAWCWNVPTPSLAVTGEIYDQLFIDGIYLAYNWALLTAVNERGEVVAWQWATSEKGGQDAPARQRHAVLSNTFWPVSRIAWVQAEFTPTASCVNAQRKPEQ